LAAEHISVGLVDLLQQLRHTFCIRYIQSGETDEAEILNWGEGRGRRGGERRGRREGGGGGRWSKGGVQVGEGGAKEGGEGRDTKCEFVNE
jgi:hypothetical protein